MPGRTSQTRGEIRGSTETILVVEDVRVTLVKRILGFKGYRVLEAEGPKLWSGDHASGLTLLTDL